MRSSAYWITIFLFLGLSGCEAHDYFALPETITVNSEEGVFRANDGDSISQDLFVRYQVDYLLDNLSDTQSSEVVVSATSYVNGFPRISGHKVWHLSPSEEVEGILTTSQLQLGNRLEVALSCCSESMCSSREVVCPKEDFNRTGKEVAEFCFDSCMSDESCELLCPSNVKCDEVCKHGDGMELAEYEECRSMVCGNLMLEYSCGYQCLNDASCLETCVPAEECVQGYCKSQKASCFRNCVSMYYRCKSDFYEADTNIIPCSLCGGEGACYVNMEMTSLDALSIQSTDGQTEYSCKSECRQYPSECVTGCEDLYEDKESRMNCLDACIRQHLRWCNDNVVPEAYIDSQSNQPCCYGAYCHASLDGVVKTYDVQCFNNTDCSSTKVCSEEGVCVHSGKSSCSSAPLQRPSHSYWLIILAAGYCIVRRRGTKHD